MKRFLKTTEEGETGTRPEWIVKTWYLDMFASVIEAYQAHDEYKQTHDGSYHPALRAKWISLLRQISVALWAKINKNRAKLKDVWANLIAVSQNAPLNDADAYQAMKEISVFFEHYGYTKVETEMTPAYEAVIKER